MDNDANLNNVQHRFELAEDENLVAPVKEFVEQPLQDHHFATRIDEFIVQHRLHRLRVDGPVKEERVATDFTKLHDGVLEVQIIDLLDYEHSQYLVVHKKQRLALSLVRVLGAQLFERLVRVLLLRPLILNTLDLSAL